MSAPLHHSSAEAPDQCEPIVCTVAGPRLGFSKEIYTGAELLRAPVRSGALDALALPSLFNGQRRNPGTPAPEVSTVWTPPPSAPPDPAYMRQPACVDPSRQPGPIRILSSAQRAARAQYAPRPGSVPSLVLNDLHASGGHIFYGDIAKRFGFERTSITAVFKVALDKKALIRVTIGGRVALALPGYKPPFVPEPPKAPKTTHRKLARAERLLARRSTALQRLQVQVADLKARVQTLREATAHGSALRAPAP